MKTRAKNLLLGWSLCLFGFVWTISALVLHAFTSPTLPTGQPYTLIQGGTANDSQALQNALDGLAPNGVVELRGEFNLAQPVTCLGKPVIVRAEGATLTYTGPDGQPALTFGYAPGDKNTFTDGLTLHGLRLVGPSRVDGKAIGLRIQNAYAPLVDDLAARGFGVGLELVGDGVGCTYGRCSLRRMKDNTTQIHCLAQNGGFVTEWNFYGPGNLSYNAPYKGQSCCHLLCENVGTVKSAIGALRFLGVSFEGQDDSCMVADVASYGGNICWLDCRYEAITHKPMALKLGPQTFRCRLIGNTTADVSWQDGAPAKSDNQFLPWWK